MGLGHYVVDAVVLEGRSPTRQIPRPPNRLNQAMTAHRIACQVRTVITESKEDTMATPTGAPGATNLPDYAPVPQFAIGPALNEQGYYVGRVERNLYWITDGSCQSAFLATKDRAGTGLALGERA